MDLGLLVLLFVFFGVPAIAFGTIFFVNRYYRARRQAVLKREIDPNWLAIIRRNLPLFSELPFELQQRLEKDLKLFLAQVRFEGCGGQEVDDEIRVTIAAQACLLTLGRHSKQLYPDLKSILVYPSSFSGGPKGIFGTDLDANISRLGESWQSGSVVLAWDSSRRGVLNPSDGKNVIIHEFAHQLDQADGSADGRPLLGAKSAYVTWAEVMTKEYANQARKALKNQRSVIDHYGATNPAEFFAAATEAFFEKPKQLHRKHPEVYRILKRYYHLDPASWSTAE